MIMSLSDMLKIPFQQLKLSKDFELCRAGEQALEEEMFVKEW